MNKHVVLMRKVDMFQVTTGSLCKLEKIEKTDPFKTF